MKWLFYVVVFIYMAYRAVYGAKIKDSTSIVVDPINYGEYEDYLPPNTHKSISCKYTNKNQKVEWLDTFKNPIPLSLSKRIATQKHTGPLVRGERTYSLVLTFSDTQVEDTGEYECRSGDHSEKVTLCVIGPAEFVDTPSEVIMDEGRSYTLSCQARGQPEPRIVWVRNGEEISDEGEANSKYQVMTKYNSHGFEGLLTINSLAPKDQGEYTCMALQENTAVEDCNLIRHMNITVVVNYAPVFEDGNETVIYGKYNESIDFACSADAYPPPTYRWFHALDDNTLFEYPKESLVFSKVKSEAKYTTVANALSFGQTYICEAVNEHGVARKSYTLLKVEKPKRPSEVNVYNISDTHVDLNISWAEPVLFPIEDIEVQFMPERTKIRLPKETDWKKASIAEIDVGEVVEIENEAAVITLKNLQPESNYWVRVRVSNELGYSPWSIPILVVTNPTDEEDTGEPISTTEEDVSEGELLLITVDEEDENNGSNDAMFYGIFFAGGILVLSFACTIIMKLV